jgi:uncharacterized membrane protein
MNRSDYLRFTFWAVDAEGAAVALALAFVSERKRNVAYSKLIETS